MSLETQSIVELFKRNNQTDNLRLPGYELSGLWGSRGCYDSLRKKKRYRTASLGVKKRGEAFFIRFHAINIKKNIT